MKVVQILGGLGRPEAETHGTDLTRRIAEVFGCKPRLLPAPGIVSSKMVKDALMSDLQIADTLTLAAQADIALVGIGRPTPDSVVMQAGTLTEIQFRQLQDCGAVGDIALRFFDINGQAVDHEICNRVMGLDLDQIKNIPRVIGAAGGEEKFEAIYAAVKGKLVNVLITDDKTAIRLLEEDGDKITNSKTEIPAIVT
jgi:DNA-binding transcriptional regulator LsrR (DeoR family)